MRIFVSISVFLLLCLLSSCATLKDSSKYEFRDGIYHTGLLSKNNNKVYVYNVDDDTLVVCPVLEFPDSTSVLTKQKTIYTGLQKKFKDGKVQHTFFKPSFDIDAITLPLIFRPAADGIPNQLATNFNGALFLGYRTDVYMVEYTRTPFNVYKQNVKHYGISSGLFLGISSTLIDNNSTHNTIISKDYDGVTLLYGLGVNLAVENLSFGVCLGLGDLMDRNKEYWIYESKPFIGFTLGINLN